MRTINLKYRIKMNTSRSPHCAFCKSTDHFLKTLTGETICRALLTAICANCGETGHTTKGCKSKSASKKAKLEHVKSASGWEIVTKKKNHSSERASNSSVPIKPVQSVQTKSIVIQEQEPKKVQKQTTWATVASKQYVEPAKKADEEFETMLLQKAKEKQEKIEKAKMARQEKLLQWQKEQNARLEKRERELEAEHINAMKELHGERWYAKIAGTKDECAESRRIYEEEQKTHEMRIKKEKEVVEKNKRTMTKTQFRKWERGQNEKQKAVDEARLFEEITLVASLSDSAKEYYHQTGIILSSK